MQPDGVPRGVVQAEALDQAHDGHPGRQFLGHLVPLDAADDDEHRDTGLDRQPDHPADGLARERLGVEVALAGDDQVGAGDALGQVEGLRHQVEAGDEDRPRGGQSPGQAAGRARAG